MSPYVRTNPAGIARTRRTIRAARSSASGRGDLFIAPTMRAFEVRGRGIGWGGRIRTFNLLIQVDPPCRRSQFELKHWLPRVRNRYPSGGFGQVVGVVPYQRTPTNWPPKPQFSAALGAFTRRTPI